MTRSRILIAALMLSFGVAEAQVAAPAATPLTDRVGAADASIETMGAALTAARARLEEARADEDLVVVNCVNRALAAIKGLVGLSKQARISLTESMAAGDGELIEHHLQRIALAGSRVRSFKVQVEACVGEADQSTGQTSMDLQVDPLQRSDDPSRTTTPPAFTAVNVDRPPAVSGSQ